MRAAYLALLLTLLTLPVGAYIYRDSLRPAVQVPPRPGPHVRSLRSRSYELDSKIKALQVEVEAGVLPLGELKRRFDILEAEVWQLVVDMSI